MSSIANMAARAEAVHAELTRIQGELIEQCRSMTGTLYAEAEAHLGYASNASFWLTATLQAAAKTTTLTATDMREAAQASLRA
jgi:hypothetical protein